MPVMGIVCKVLVGSSVCYLVLSFHLVLKVKAGVPPQIEVNHCIA